MTARNTNRELELLRSEVAEFKRVVTKWQEHHEKAHSDAEKNAVTGRRWVITTCIASMLLLIALLALVLNLLGRTHGA